MNNRLRLHTKSAIYLLLVAALSIMGCNTTKHVKPGEHLLVRNNIRLKSDKVMYNRGEIKDNLAHLVGQHTNTRTFLKSVPLKLVLYNLKYKKLHRKEMASPPDTTLPKSVERPVIFDSVLMQRAALNMRSYLFNQGYFYAKITDSFSLTGKKAYTYYNINAGGNYLVNRVFYDVDDSNIVRIVRNSDKLSSFQKNKNFTFSMADNEISRLTTLIRNNGYY